MKTSTKNKIPVTAELYWKAPAKYYFDPESVDCSRMSDGEIMQEIKTDIESLLRKVPSLEVIENYYNISNAIDFWIDGDLVSPDAYSCNIPDEGLGLFQISIKVSGEMTPHNGPGAMRTWDEFEILDELERYSDLFCQGSEFAVSVSRVN